MGYIYKITNQINNKVYIGLTSEHYSYRWNQHKRNAFNKSSLNYNSKFYKDLRKYGIDNFDWIIIEECDNNFLGEREKYWINYYNSYQNGYNMTLGGEGKLLYSDEEILKYWNSGYTLTEISNIIGIYDGQLSLRLKALNVSEREIQDRSYRYRALKHGKKIYQYDLNGNYISEFTSSAEIENKLGISHADECCLNKRKTVGGYQWKYEKCEKIEPVIYNKSPGIGKRVGQYNLVTKELLNIYESAAEAARSLNKPRQNIARCCRNCAKSAYGYIWKYIDELEDNDV